MQVLQGRRQGKHLVAELEGISDRDTAESLAGREIAVYRDQLPELPDSHYYWTDLIGSSVYNQDGLELGSIKEMIATGANDVMLVQGDRERLIPFIQGEYVGQVDLVARRIIVNWDPDF
jgi:16S rRNA processing protein RimM